MPFNQVHLIDNLDAIFRERFPDATVQMNCTGVCKAISLCYINQLFYSADQGVSFLEMLQTLGLPRVEGQNIASIYLNSLYQETELLRIFMQDPEIESILPGLEDRLRKKHQQLALIENLFLLHAKDNLSDPNALYVAHIRDECYKITGLDDYVRCAFLVSSDSQIESFFTPGHEASPFVENGIYELSTHSHSMLVKVDKESCLELFDPNQGWLTEQEVKTFFKSNSNLSELSNFYKFNQDTYFMGVYALSPIETKNDPYHQPIAAVTEEQKNTVVAKIKAAQEAFKNQIQSNDSSNINVVGKDGKTPLHWAVTRNQKDLLKVLLSIPGIDINYVDAEGMTAFQLAVVAENKECVDMLWAVPGIDVYHLDALGGADLYLTEENEHKESIRALLGVGADINFIDNDGQTPLHLAAQQGNGESDGILLEADAKINLADKNGLSSLSLPIGQNNSDVLSVPLLFTKDNQPKDPKSSQHIPQPSAPTP
jgi:hypothetical protein